MPQFIEAPAETATLSPEFLVGPAVRSWALALKVRSWALALKVRSWALALKVRSSRVGSALPSSTLHHQ